MLGVAHDPAFAKKVGIPQSVGKEFVGDAPCTAAGALLISKDGEVLLMKRGPNADHAGEWALPGGKVEDGETAEATARRETQEETAYMPGPTMRFWSRTLSGDGVDFSTYAQKVDKFEPTLNDEHTEARWVSLDDLPAKLHPGLKASIAPLTPGEDMSPEDWQGFVQGFLKFISEEEEEPEHAQDSVPLALDKESVRQYTKDGFLRVTRTPISKANVCDYYGREIPNAEAMGLDPTRKYALLRHPDELKKAAESFNGVPLLIKHTPVNPDDHRPDLTVGSVGTSAEYDHPYLYNSLTITAREGIEAVESEAQRELSSGYRYRADMTPGVYQGVRYDGIMRDIGGNHVALVSEGRAGADVYVGDSKPENPKEFPMPKSTVVLSRTAVNARGAIAAFLLPKMAQDQKIDLTPILRDVTAKNFAAQKTNIISSVKTAVAGKLAKDAKIDDIGMLMDALEDDEVAEGADTDPDTGKPMSKDEMEKAAKDKAAKDEAEEEEEEKKKKEAEDKAARDAKAKDEEVKEPKVTKAAMDEAIKIATVKATKDAMKLAADIRTAEKEVKPYVGELAMAHDSVEGVYRTAIGAMNLKVEGLDSLPAAALKAIIVSQPAPNTRQRVPLAQDARPANAGQDYLTRFPAAGKVGTSL